jgi:hypothetical protein
LKIKLNKYKTHIRNPWISRCTSRLLRGRKRAVGKYYLFLIYLNVLETKNSPRMEFFTSRPVGLFFYHSVCTFLTLPFQEGAYYIWTRGREA